MERLEVKVKVKMDVRLTAARQQATSLMPAGSLHSFSLANSLAMQ